MNREAKKEIRRVLMGRTLISEDGRLVAMEKGQLRMPMGVGDGAVGVRFFGVCRMSRRLKVSCAPDRARSLAYGVLQDMGRIIYLPQQPEAAACLIRYLLTRPVLLVFDYQEEVPVLTAWTGRGLTAWFSLRRSVKAFLKKMPKQFSLSQELTPDEKEKAARKAQKKKEKEEARRKKRAAKSGAAADGGAPNIKEESVHESESESH